MPSAGAISLDVITDFQKGLDKIDLSGIDANMTLGGDQAFIFRGSSANKNMGDLTFKVYESINGAENALGMDIDGIAGPGAAGPVTIVFGNVDGGAPDFAIALLNTRGVTASDFIDHVTPTATAAMSALGSASASASAYHSAAFAGSDYLF